MCGCVYVHIYMCLCACVCACVMLQIMDRRKTEQVVLVESTLQLELVAEVEERRTKEEKLLELQDKLYFDLKHDIVEEVSRRKV